MKIINDMFNYIKYGRIIYKSPSGNVIRKAVSPKRYYSDKSYGYSVSKAVLDSSGKLIKKIKRAVYNDTNILQMDFRVSQIDKNDYRTLLTNKTYIINSKYKNIINFLL